ncbi:MAG TPA: TetR/AcrR family transcriptional regulator [Solirubrobacterales bacterium]|nr:TetR/AcrR family transcriptional regulator [Solirubrobacterales bacterium]
MSEARENLVRRLPPGPHGIPPELVERNQRERLIAAMAEVSSECGYAESTVAEISKRAGVSTASFYRQFKDRRACMLVSFEELFGRLLGEVEGACNGEMEREAKVRAGVGTAAVLLAADPPTARLLTVEIVAVGLEGVRLQHDAIEQLATRLREAHEHGAALAKLPSAEWTVVVAMVALVSRRTAEGESASVAELEAICKHL